MQTRGKQFAISPITCLEQSLLPPVEGSRSESISQIVQQSKLIRFEENGLCFLYQITNAGELRLYKMYYYDVLWDHYFSDLLTVCVCISIIQWIQQMIKVPTALTKLKSINQSINPAVCLYRGSSVRHSRPWNEAGLYNCLGKETHYLAADPAPGQQSG